MKLLTKELLEQLPLLRGQENVEDPIAYAKFFNPYGIGRWFIMEYDLESQIAFGYVSLFGDYNDELGNFSMQELEEIRVPMMKGLKPTETLERDLSFAPTPLSEIKKQYTRSN